MKLDNSVFSEIFHIVQTFGQRTTHRYRPAAKGGNPKISDIVFSLLIIHPWCVYNEIWGGVEVSPLSNFKYSRWRPRWLPRRKFLLCRCFSATDQPRFGQYACFGFNGWNRKGLRIIVCSVAIVTSNTANV